MEALIQIILTPITPSYSITTKDFGEPRQPAPLPLTDPVFISVSFPHYGLLLFFFLSHSSRATQRGATLHSMRGGLKIPSGGRFSGGGRGRLIRKPGPYSFYEMCSSLTTLYDLSIFLFILFYFFSHSKSAEADYVLADLGGNDLNENLQSRGIRHLASSTGSSPRFDPL